MPNHKDRDGTTGPNPGSAGGPSVGPAAGAELTIDKAAIQAQVKRDIEAGKQPPGDNEDHAARRKERVEFEAEASGLLARLEESEKQLDRLPYLTQNQLLVVIADVARTQIEACRLVLEKKKRV